MSDDLDQLQTIAAGSHSGSQKRLDLSSCEGGGERKAQGERSIRGPARQGDVVHQTGNQPGIQPAREIPGQELGKTAIQLACQLLTENGINPNDLSQTQLQQFSKQSLGDQATSIAMWLVDPKRRENFERCGSDAVEENENEAATVMAPGQREGDNMDLRQAYQLLERIGVDWRSLTRSQVEDFSDLSPDRQETVVSTYFKNILFKRRQQVGKNEMASGDIPREEDVHQSDSMDESQGIRQTGVLLSENGINPNNLSQVQLEQFSRQTPFVQAMSIDNLNRPEDFEGHDIVPTQLWARPYPIPRVRRIAITDTSRPQSS